MDNKLPSFSQNLYPKTSYLTYDTSSYSLMESVARLIWLYENNVKAYNELLDYVNETFGYILGEALDRSVEKVINKMYEDGRLAEIINEQIFNILNTAINSEAVNISQFPREEGEQDDFGRWVRCYEYCFEKKYRAILISENIDIGNNTINIDTKYFNIFGNIRGENKATITGNNTYIITVNEQGFAMDNIRLNGKMDVNGAWSISPYRGIKYSYNKQDMDTTITNCVFTNFYLAIEFYGRNLNFKNNLFGTCYKFITLAKNNQDLNNPYGVDIRGINIQDCTSHTVHTNTKGQGDVIIEVLDETNTPDIRIKNLTIEQGCKRFFRGYINGVKIEGLNTSNINGADKFIEILPRSPQIPLRSSSITGDILFNGSNYDLTLNDVANNAIYADKLENCYISIKTSNCRQNAIRINTSNGNIINGCVNRNVGYRTEDGQNVYSAIKIGTSVNDVIFDNYNNSVNGKANIEIENGLNGSRVFDNQNFYSPKGELLSPNGYLFNNLMTGTEETLRLASDTPTANSIVNSKQSALNMNNTKQLASKIDTAYIDGDSSSNLTTNMQFYIADGTGIKRIAVVNKYGMSAENGRKVGLGYNRYIWSDSSGTIRVGSGQDDIETGGAVLPL